MLKSIDEKVQPSPGKKIKKDPSPEKTKIKEAKKIPSPSPSKTISSPKLATKNSKTSQKTAKSSPKTDEAKREANIVLTKQSTNGDIKKEVNVAIAKKVEDEVSKAILERPQSEPIPLDSQLWVDKYKPTTTQVCPKLHFAKYLLTS